MKKKATCKICGQQFTKTGNYQKYCCVCKASVRREQVRKASAKYYSNADNAVKQRARAKTEYAIQTGKIHPENQCVVCGGQDNLQQHHICYSGRFSHLATVTLCSKCHWEQHKRLNRQQRARKRRRGEQSK